MYWIVIANTNHYRIFTYEKGVHEFSLLKESDDPEGRKKDIDLSSDRPGHYSTRTTTQGSFSAHADPKVDEVDRFLKALAEKCESGRTANQYKKVILIAPPEVNGIFLKHVNKKLELVIVNNMKKDFTHLGERELAQFVKDNWLELHNGVNIS